jgi:hypothetical protein
LNLASPNVDGDDVEADLGIINTNYNIYFPGSWSKELVKRICQQQETFSFQILGKMNGVLYLIAVKNM